MNVLVVDDETSKREQVVEFLRGVAQVAAVTEARSYQGALSALRGASFDWVVLDMRLTTFDVSQGDDGGRPRNSGGNEILRKMKRRRHTSNVVVLTQYSIFHEGGGVLTLEALSEQLSLKYPYFQGVVQFLHSSDTWKSGLTNLMFEGEV